ncbi:uncharacterized protein [Embiotoca jacksoni]|uniref:uncharacterized protein n=1 Tax=Embiotoca jacksoni TaxID=100190 RepID=UPI00370398BD
MHGAGFCFARMTQFTCHLLISAVVVQLCFAQDIPCNVTQEPGGTRYSIPKLEGTDCTYSWSDSNGYEYTVNCFTTCIEKTVHQKKGATPRNHWSVLIVFVVWVLGYNGPRAFILAIRRGEILLFMMLQNNLQVVEPEAGRRPPRRTEPEAGRRPRWRQQEPEAGRRPRQRQQEPEAGRRPRQRQQEPEAGRRPPRRTEPEAGRRPRWRQQEPEAGRRPRQRQQGPVAGRRPRRRQQEP